MAVGDSADRSDARVVEGLVLMRRGRAREAAAAFREAERWRPGAEQPGVCEAPPRRSAGDRAAAAAAGGRGAAAAATTAQLRALLAELAAAR